MAERFKFSVVVLLLVGAVTLAGCTGQELRFTADRATVPSGTLDSTGYEERLSTTQNVTREFDAAGQTRDVTAVNRITVYQRNISVPGMGERPLAGFVTVSSPSISIVGNEYNPLADFSNRELLNQITARQEFRQEYGQLRDLTLVGNRTLTVLGTETELAKFEATVEIRGTPVNVSGYVMKVKHDEDFVVAAGVYPSQLEGQEEPRLLELFRNLEH